MAPSLPPRRTGGRELSDSETRFPFRDSGAEVSSRSLPVGAPCCPAHAIILTGLSFVVWALPLLAAEPRPVTVNDVLPFGQRPIDYWASDSSDVVAALQRRLDDGAGELPFEPRWGYLPAVLRELDIPVESQLLTFRTHSPHRSAIQPERPRAIYFNDDVSVAWYPGAAQLELAAHDSHKGTLFYTLTNRADAEQRFQRNAGQACLGCHHVPGNPQWTGVTVPGHLVRSFLPEATAKRYPFGDTLSHALPLEQRWRHWYVTGIQGTQRHLGNQSRSEDERSSADDPQSSRAVFDLADEFDVDRYPTNTSDVVAHLIFDHQMLGLNLLSRLSYEHQLHVRSEIEPMVVRYLLLADEAPLKRPVAGTSAYAERYRRRGPKDAQGRSLYELDLETRLFRWRISPLVSSRMVQGLPVELRQRLFERLDRLLSGQETLEGYSMPEADRQETRAVLRGTVPDWPGG
jgi:hypothetical protein